MSGFEINKEIIIVCVVILLIILLIIINTHKESFDEKTVEFVQSGCPRYGLRGDLLRRSGIDKLYMNKNRNMVLNPTSGLMWESDNSPTDEKMPNCKKTDCPNINGAFDNLDTCWQCGSADYYKMDIPDIHPHVRN